MRIASWPVAPLALACALGWACPSRPALAQQKPAAARPSATPLPAPQPGVPPAPSGTPVPYAAQAATACGTKAARYVGDKAFEVFVTRLGQAKVENPLRPLTPDLTEVLQVTIAGRMATAYGPDLGALRRGGPPNALEAQLGASIRWDADLPLLPDPLTIVSEAGAPLARLSFRDCTDAPPVKAPPPVVAKKDAKPARTRAARKTGGPVAAPGPSPATSSQAPAAAPPGFTLPQGAIAE